MGLCEGKGVLSADDKAGLLKFRLREGNYRQSFNIQVPFFYPEEGVEIEFLSSSNFPSEIQQIYLSQAQEISRRCVAGIPPDQEAEVNHSRSVSALTSSLPLSLPLSDLTPSTSARRLAIPHVCRLQHVQSNLRPHTSP
jgi:hypothetical protein